MSLLLYALTALLLLFLAARAVTPLSRGAALVLFLLPFCFVGRALLTDNVYAPVDLPYVTEPLKGMREPMGMPEIHNGVISDLYAQMIPWRKAVQYAYAHGQWPLWNPFILSGSVLAASAQPAAYSPFTLIALLLPVAKGLTFSAPLTLFLARAWALFPLVLLATRRCVRAPSLRSASFLCAVLVIEVLAGHPETLLHIIFVGGIR